MKGQKRSLQAQLGYLELRVVVHPPQGGRGHAGGTGAIRSLQGLLHQGNGLEVVLLPEAGQVGKEAQGSAPGGYTAATDKSQPGQLHPPQPHSTEGPVSSLPAGSCFTGQQNHPGCWLPPQRPQHLYSQALKACPPFTSGAKVASIGRRPQASGASVQGSRSLLAGDEPFSGKSYDLGDLA